MAVRQSVEIAVTIPSGERLRFMVLSATDLVDAWHHAMRSM
jgi:hypothetical protein